MRELLRPSAAFLGAVLITCLPPTHATAQDPGKQTSGNIPSTNSGTRTDSPSQEKRDQEPPEFNLLNAMQQGLVSVKAEGRGDGRITISVMNRTNRPLRVVLPPGIVAEGASGQMGGMGGAHSAAWEAEWVAWAVVAWVAGAVVAWAVAWVAGWCWAAE